MDDMDLNVRHEYAASPDAVHTMLTSPDYLSDLGQAHDTAITVENEGDVSSLTVQAKAPDQVRSMVGETLSVDARVLWERDGEGWRGVVEVAKTDGVDEDSSLMAVLEAGAEEVEDMGESFEIYSEPGDIVAVRTALTEAGMDYDSAEVQFVAGTKVEVDIEGARKVFRLIDALEDSDDVQNVYTSVDLSPEVAAEFAGDED